MGNALGKKQGLRPAPSRSALNQVKSNLPEIELRNRIWQEIEAKRTYLQGNKSVESEIQKLSFELNQLKVGINKLPVELLCLVFGHLNLLQLSVCQSVCLKWHAIVKSLNVHNLVVDEEDKPFGVNFTTSELSYSSFCSLAANPKSKLSTSICSNMKCLKILNTYQERIHIDFINSLTELEDLHIAFYENDKEVLETISLPNLKSLSITNCLWGLILNAPKLTKYKSVGRFPNSIFVFPPRITDIFADRFEGILEMLANLRVLSLNDPDVYRMAKFSNDEDRVRQHSATEESFEKRRFADRLLRCAAGE